MSESATQQVVCLARRPVGVPTAEDFRLLSLPMPQPDADQLLLKVRCLSLDPYLRSVIAGRHLGAAIDLGDVMPGSGVAEVLQSTPAGPAVGSLVIAEVGWCEYACVDTASVRVIDKRICPPTLALHVLGMPGLTAWAGMRGIARPQRGQTVVVSAASGAVGSCVGQLALADGARVIGIAGSEQKCRYVVEQLGFDECINHRLADFGHRLAAACPDRIDVYFDNVGGPVLEACLGRLALHAQVVLCGLIDQYNATAKAVGPNLGPVIGARASMTGLVVYDHWDGMPELVDEVLPKILAGQFHFTEDIAEGLESAPAQFCKLMNGRNFGKSLVRVSN